MRATDPLVPLTYQVPLSTGDVAGDICLQHLQVQSEASVRPGAKFQVTFLNIEWEPEHIDVAGALEDPWDGGEKSQKRPQISHPGRGWGGSIITRAPFTHTFTFRSNLDSRIKTGLHVFGAQEESGEKTDTGRVPYF